MKLLKKFLSLMALLFFIPSNCVAATSATVTVMAVILAGESSLSVDTNLVDFGAVSGSVDNRRFVGGPVIVSYYPASNPWSIRVYTANPGNALGLVGMADSSMNIPLKVWCDNFGPRLHAAGQAPDEENRFFWSGYDFNGDNDRIDIISDGSISEAALGFDVNGDGDALDSGLGAPSAPVSEEPAWLRVPDDNEMTPGNPYTWRRLA